MISFGFAMKTMIHAYDKYKSLRVEVQTGNCARKLAKQIFKDTIFWKNLMS